MTFHFFLKVGSLKLKAPLASEDSQDSITRLKSTSSGTHVVQGDIQRATSESVLEDNNTPNLPLKKVFFKNDSNFLAIFFLFRRGCQVRTSQQEF